VLRASGLDGDRWKELISVHAKVRVNVNASLPLAGIDERPAGAANPAR